MRLLAILAFIFFAEAARALAAPCDASLRSMLGAPPAVLPTSLAAHYASGVVVRMSLKVDPSGRVLSITSDAASQALRGVASAWAKRIRYAALPASCKPQISSIDDQDVEFYPPSSGVVGVPKIVGGVDFDNLRYTDGPGNCKTAAMRDGEASYPPDMWDASVDNVYAGRINGISTAIVILRCEYNGHGFDQDAQLFALQDRRARRLGILGYGSLVGPDTPFPPWPGGWIHVSFTGGRLYADTWDDANKCDRRRDWLSSIYTIRSGKLVRLSAVHHHRAGIDLACDIIR